MASKSIQPEILKLQERSAASRAALQAEFLQLKHRLDVPARIKESLREQPSSWLFGSTALGLGSALLLPLLRRRKHSRTTADPKKGNALVHFAWKVAQPILKQWLTKTLTQALTRPRQAN